MYVSELIQRTSIDPGSPRPGWHIRCLRWCGDAPSLTRRAYRSRVSYWCHQLDKVSIAWYAENHALIEFVQISEEGARFPISMVSSGVWAGQIPIEKAHNLQEVGGGRQTMRQELHRIGYLGSVEASYKAMPIGVR